MEVTSFLKYLQHEKRYSAHTLTSYTNDLGQFSTYLLNTYEIEHAAHVTHPMVRSWMVQLMEEGISPRSINRKLSALKSYFKYLLKKGQIQKNPMGKIVSPKVPKRLPQFVEQQSIQKLFNEIKFADGFTGQRDRILLEILYATGTRVSELIGMKDSDIDTYNMQVKVLGKGNKERIVPLDRQLIQRIQDYIAEKRKLFGREEPYLLVTDKGKKLYPKFAYNVVKRHLSQVTTINKKSPHVMRHTFATHLSNNGADLNAIKELLGHASLAATQVYTHNTIDKLKEIHKQAHPKS